jgi:DNA-binding cell septation regulator SpoVG
LAAYADATLDDFIVLKGFRILVGKSGGLFVGMPYKKRQRWKIL